MTDILVLLFITLLLLFRYNRILGQKLGLDKDYKNHLKNRSQIKTEKYYGFAEETNEIRKYIKSFSIADFCQSASSAFQIITKAFYDKNHKNIKSFISEEILNAFKETSIDEEIVIIKIISVKVLNIEIEDTNAKITVKIASLQAPKSNMNDIEDTDDVWTFQRDLTNKRSKIWVLIQTLQ